MNATAKVLLYSDDRTVRERVRVALGRRVASDVPELEIDEVATHHAVVSAVETQTYQLCILDGEAVPAGGMGVAKQIKDEVRDCPPVLLLVARPQDAWLATWSGAEAVSPYPVDPVRLPSAVAELLRGAQKSGARG
mgnify:CR=1 FL=1